MALTFRTGSGGKGSALTIDELDNNFRHFTGSHTVSGSVTVSGSINISGSIIPTEETATLGTEAHPFKELFVTDSSIIFVSGSTTSSFGVDSSGSLSGSFDGDFTGSFSGSGHITGSLTGSFTGSGLVTDITASGNISSSANVAGLSGSFTALILTAPNGNQFKFTTDNSGILSITGSAV